jgi:hydrogenase expression/formation protein HypC
MCLAIPVRVVRRLHEQWVDAEAGGVIRRVSTAFIGEVDPGEYLIVEFGFAITRLDAGEARMTLALFDEIAAKLNEVEASRPEAGLSSSAGPPC